jgi:hypothetical protein
MKEIRGIRGDRPLTDDEMEAAKNALVQRSAEPLQLGVGRRRRDQRALPERSSRGLLPALRGLGERRDEGRTSVRVARKYIDPDHLAIVIVGDRKEIQKPLEALKIAPIVLLI